MADQIDNKTDGLNECPRARQWARAAFEADIAYLLNRAAEIARGEVGAALAAFGVSPRQMAVMRLLSLHQPLSQHELGGLLGIDRTSMVGLIDGLEKAGYVVRQCDPADRRAYALRLTEAGTAANTSIRDSMEQTQDRLLTPLTDGERGELIRMLGKLTWNERGNDQRDG